MAGVRERISRAADRAGRDPASIRLVAVSKTFPVDAVRAAAAAGQVDFGENKVQEGVAKIEELTDLPLRWHLIGHLQSNKVSKAVRFDAVHSVDSAALLAKLDRAAAATTRTIQVMVQVDLAKEPTKHGAPEEDLPRIFDVAATCLSARVTGLMLLPPAVDDPDAARPFFRRLRDLRNTLLERGVALPLVSELSMGMSHDFEVAVEEGATIVRVGTAIFGHRPTG